PLVGGERRRHQYRGNLTMVGDLDDLSGQHITKDLRAVVPELAVANRTHRHHPSPDRAPHQPSVAIVADPGSLSVFLTRTRLGRVVSGDLVVVTAAAVPRRVGAGSLPGSFATSPGDSDRVDRVQGEGAEVGWVAATTTLFVWPRRAEWPTWRP